MAVGRLPEIVQGMLDVSYPTDTPVAIIESATTPNERVTRGTLLTIVDIANDKKVKAPATIIFGGVVNALL